MAHSQRPRLPSNTLRSVAGRGCAMIGSLLPLSVYSRPRCTPPTYPTHFTVTNHWETSGLSSTVVLPLESTSHCASPFVHLIFLSDCLYSTASRHSLTPEVSVLRYTKGSLPRRRLLISIVVPLKEGKCRPCSQCIYSSHLSVEHHPLCNTPNTSILRTSKFAIKIGHVKIWHVD
jgi:hypothetical protein